MRFNVLFAMLAAAGAASGQTVTLSFSGSGSNAGNGGGGNGSGTGTLTPGGTAALSFTYASSNDNCTSVIQFSMNFLIDANDSVNVFFNGQIPASLTNTNGGRASGTLTGTLTVTGGTGTYSGKGGTGTASIPVQLSSKTFTFMLTGSLTLAGAVVPVATVTPSGIVPVFSDDAVVQPTSWVSIYGNNLANATTLWNGNFPTSLGGVSVTIDSKPAYLWFVSGGQINLQVPTDANSGCVPVVVTTPNGSVTTSVDLEGISPSFSLLGNSFVAGVIPTPNGGGAYGGGTYDLVGPSGAFTFNTRPVKRGETVALYGVGFGGTSPSVPAGQVYSSAAQSINKVQVTLCNSSGNNCVQGVVAGNSAYLVGAGLFQINVTVPMNAPTGNLNIQASVGANGSGGNNNGVQTSGDINVLLPVQ